MPAMSPRAATNRTSLLALFLATQGVVACGYHLAGKGGGLPANIQSVGIPIFENRTSRPELEQRVTEHVIDEFTIRGRVRILPGEEGADAVLRGMLFTYTTTPVVLNPEGRATRYEILITARVVLSEPATDKVLWEDDHFLFKRQYDVPEVSLTFVDQEIVAIDNVASDFARSVVSSILEGF